VGEWKLFHPRRLLVEIEPACRPGGSCIGPRLHEPPVRYGGQKTVNWNGAAHVSQLHVEGVPLAVGVEGLFIEAIGPRPDEWYSAHCGVRFERLDRREGPPQNVRAVDFHLEGDVADRRRDRNGRAGFQILELDDVTAVANRIRLGG
jgi:hypothetical protein